MQRFRDTFPFVLIVCFLLIISSSIILKISGFQWIPNSEENRKLAEIPIFNGSVQHYIKNYEKYFNDHFGFRNELVRLNSLVMLALRVSPSSQVILGKDGWLFYDGQPGERIIDLYYRGTKPFTDDELKACRSVLQEHHDWLAQRGIRFLFVVAPDKESIYSEFLPNIHRVTSKGRLDQLIEYMKKYSDVEVLDLRESLINAKKLGLLFLKQIPTGILWEPILVMLQQLILLVSGFIMLNQSPIDALTIKKEISLAGI